MLQRILLAGWLLLAAWGTHAPIATAQSPAAGLTHRLAPTPVVSFGSVAAWSARDGRGRFWLVVRTGSGAPRTVPVPSSRSAFDVDLGPGPGGQGTWAVYSRCAGIPSRCTLRGTDLATGRERRVGGTATGRLPAIWGSRIAYFGPARHHRSPLRLTDVAGRIDRAVPQRPVADEELPVALDLRGDRVAYVLRTYDAGDDAHDTQFLFTARTDGTRLHRVDTGGDGEECTTNLASPAFISGVSDVLVWLHAAQGTQSTCRPHPQLRRLTLASGAEAYAPVAAAPVAAALVDGHALVLATPPGTADVFTREACRQEGGQQDACDLTEVPAPAWHATPG